MKKIRKLLPFSIYDIPGMEQWLAQQANEGLFPVLLDSWATFTPTGVPGTKFHLEPRGKEGSEPDQELRQMYREAGWEYALSVGNVYYLFYATDPEAPPLYSDANSWGLSLERIEKRVQRYRKRRRIAYGILAAVLIWAVFFCQSKYDAQPDRFAGLPLLALELTRVEILLFGGVCLFTWRGSRRDRKILRRTCEALKEGLPPPPSPGPNRAIARENLIALLLLPPLVLGVVVQQIGIYVPQMKNIPLEEFQKPYLAIQDLEQQEILYWEDDYEEPRNRRENVVQIKSSLLAPTWYTVSQDGYSPIPGEKAGTYSPDPEGGKYTYAPNLDATYFRLLHPALGPMVAKAQLYNARLVNLYWVYEEVDYPGLDFVILASAQHHDVWQMAAVGKGRNVAVFRYGGVEQLRQRLDVLATAVE